jgi:hypothetical protein
MEVHQCNGYNMDQYIEKLNRILIDNNVCKSHGIDHAIAVLKNAINATKFISNLSNHEKKLIYIDHIIKCIIIYIH